ncbi:MAG: NnrU family protein [Rhodospirillales bacterium]|nr:NnrU family protein [Alphaproteobacteria bacterium]MBL6948473.1 NnrU family protein [Rhodospirillales bacterium]
MTDLILAMGVFLAAHMIPAVKPVRAKLVRAIGEPVYLIAYSAVSLAVIIWMIWAYAAAPHVELWPPADWMRWLAVVVMAPACVLTVAGITTPNPFSLGWGRKGFDAARPGIVRITRHPVIWGLGLWAGVHILVNGDLASLILFGLLGVLGLAGPASLDAKRRSVLGAEAFEVLKAEVARTALSDALAQAGALRIGGGLALWAGLLAIHEWAVGVAPIVL